MTELVWIHRKTPEEVRNLMQDRLSAAGIGDKVNWTGDQFAASVGWGTILNLTGEIEPTVVVIHKCSGAIGGLVLDKCRAAFREMFPAGEEVTPTPKPVREKVLP